MPASTTFRRVVFWVAILAVTVDMGAQQPANSTPSPSAIKLPAGSLPIKSEAIVAEIRAAYYHPDDLSGLDCKVVLDWEKLLQTMKLAPSPERLKALEGFSAHSESARNQTTKLTFNWANGEPAGKDQMENGLRQMVDGFYQMYWPAIAKVPVEGSEIKEIQPQPDGGVLLLAPSGSTHTSVLVDKDRLPIVFKFDSVAASGTIEMQYAPSPVRVPGDLRRMTGVKVSQKIGESAFKVNVGLTYQTTGGFNIPERVTFELVGAYSVAMEFSSCSVSKEVKVAPPSQ